MKIAFRADAGIRQGTGHVVRTLTLAREFQNSGHHVQMFGEIQSIPWLKDMVSRTGISYQFSPINELDPPNFVRSEFDLLVVDSYEISAESINAASKEIETLAIVDNETRGIETQVLLDQNFAAQEFIAKTGIHQLIGPKFALVRKEINDIKRLNSIRVSKGSRPNILVMIGGTDPFNFALLIGEMIAVLDPEFEIHFVTTNQNRKLIQKLVPSNSENIHGLTPRIQSLLKRADVVISAAGTSTLDISCIGIPSIYFSVTDNQRPALDAISKFELGIAVHREGKDSLVSASLRDAVYSCTFDEHLREKLFTNCQQMVDGFGANRIVKFFECNRKTKSSQ